LQLQRGAFANPSSYFRKYADLSPTEAVATASDIWNSINLPNLEQNVLPTRSRAKLILRKSENHAISKVLLRKS
jgi:type I pantothenate kinase